MKTYFALSQNSVNIGSFTSCCRYANSLLNEHDAIQIAVARGGEKRARIVGELTCDGFRLISQGRYVDVKKVRRRHAET